MSVECPAQLVAVKADIDTRYIGRRIQAVLAKVTAARKERRGRREGEGEGDKEEGIIRLLKENRSPGGGDEKRRGRGVWRGIFLVVAPDHEARPIGSWISCQRKSWHMLQGPTRSARPRKPLESWRASRAMNGPPSRDEIMLRGAEETVPADSRRACALVGDGDTCSPGGTAIQPAGTWPRLWQTLSISARGRALMHYGNAA
ncbi:hypothetical protein LI328DRAFT_171331 [Trichoderma asperelloides]|nr:hypothetical protein LI328DRAFT_171331 [Trichoderma asperelloides]